MMRIDLIRIIGQYLGDQFINRILLILINLNIYLIIHFLIIHFAFLNCIIHLSMFKLFVTKIIALILMLTILAYSVICYLKGIVLIIL